MKVQSNKNSGLLVLLQMYGYPCIFSAIFTAADNLDFLFCSLDDKTLPNSVNSKERTCSLTLKVPNKKLQQTF